MTTQIIIPMNDVWSENFESKLDPYFTSVFQSDRYGKYRHWDKDEVRSALSLSGRLRPNYASGKSWQ